MAPTVIMIERICEAGPGEFARGGRRGAELLTVDHGRVVGNASRAVTVSRTADVNTEPQRSPRRLAVDRQGLVRRRDGSRARTPPGRCTAPPRRRGWRAQRAGRPGRRRCPTVSSSTACPGSAADVPSPWCRGEPGRDRAGRRVGGHGPGLPIAGRLDVDSVAPGARTSPETVLEPGTTSEFLHTKRRSRRTSSIDGDLPVPASRPIPKRAGRTGSLPAGAILAPASAPLRVGGPGCSRKQAAGIDRDRVR